jgi:hypothetical protein
VLRAVGRVEQEFRQRIDLRLGFEQDVAQLLAERRPARLARRHDLDAAQAQQTRQQPELRGLAAPVDAFE